MYVNNKEIMNVLNKLNDLLEGGSKASFALLDMADGVLNVCYNDPTKAFFEGIPLSYEDGEVPGKYAVELGELVKAVSNCQPFGSLKADTLRLKFNEDSILSIMSYPMIDLSETDEPKLRPQGKREFKIKYFDVNSSMKTQILLRMNYESLFQAENADVWDKDEIVDYLSRCSVSKGKQVFLSSKMQQVFVDNQAYLTDIEVAPKSITDIELSQYEQQFIAQGLQGEQLDNAIKQLISRVHTSVVMLSNTAKAVCSILNKTDCDKVSVHVINTFCVFFVENETTRMGFWFQMPSASKIPVSTCMAFRAFNYNTYQLCFRNESLSDAIRYAINTTSEKATLMFEVDENGETSLKLIGTSGECLATSEETVDETNTLTGQQFVVSPKIMDDMIKGIKSDLVAFDICCTETGSVVLRLSEIDADARAEAYNLVRGELSAEEPTPADKRYWVRSKCIGPRQYTFIKK